MNWRITIVCVVCIISFSACTDEISQSQPELSPLPRSTQSDSRLSFIQLPEGFHIEYFAENIPGARSMTRSPNGTIFVGTRQEGVVYAVSDGVRVYIEGLNNPNGVAMAGNDLYVATQNQVLRYPNVEQNLNNAPQPVVIIDNLPSQSSHWWRYLALGPDNRLYLSIGAPCNICSVQDPYATIISFDLTGNNQETIARGVRNSLGFDWQPQTEVMWFSDNGRDNLGDTIPPDEINLLNTNGDHFGYPYCYGNNQTDPAFRVSCEGYSVPKLELEAHVAALGIKFYQNQLLIAEHGSWNRSEKIGYRIMQADVSGNSISNYRVFAEGWLTSSGEVTGRPVDILDLPDDSLLVSDDYAGVIYRIWYQP